tara:strand:+ start:263 stop:415 length:153 start_codon:yes stop_codon:yes gene_type:complete
MFRIGFSLVNGCLLGFVFYEADEYEKIYSEEWYNEIMISIFVIAIRIQWN